MKKTACLVLALVLLLSGCGGSSLGGIGALWGGDSPTYGGSGGYGSDQPSQEDLEEYFYTLLDMEPSYYIQCPYCEGEGVLGQSCSTCGGKGTIPHGYGLGAGVCPGCFGSGVERCGYCDDGMYPDPDYEDNYQDWVDALEETLLQMGYSSEEVEEILYGDGEDSSSGGSDSGFTSPDSGWSVPGGGFTRPDSGWSIDDAPAGGGGSYVGGDDDYCDRCYGTGNCQTCHGSGTYRNPYDLTQTLICTTCGGDGDCIYCS